METLTDIYLTWRTGKGDRRHKVGIIKKHSTQDVRFRYLVSQKEAEKIGFSPYADFPDLTKEYTENVVENFAQRLTRSERNDIRKYYDFWEIKPEFEGDKFYLLAHTQGLLATDNFEFLADYSPSEDISFASEICGLSHYKKSPDAIKEGDELQWEYDNKNEYDEHAVKVSIGNTFLGYVKIVHSSVFYKEGGKALKIKVKSVDCNGSLNRVFVKIYMDA